MNPRPGEVWMADLGFAANVQGIGSLPTVRLGRRIGTLRAETVIEIKKAIAWALELELSDSSG